MNVHIVLFLITVYVGCVWCNEGDILARDASEQADGDLLEKRALAAMEDMLKELGDAGIEEALGKTEKRFMEDPSFNDSDSDFYKKRSTANILDDPDFDKRSVEDILNNLENPFDDGSDPDDLKKKSIEDILDGLLNEEQDEDEPNDMMRKRRAAVVSVDVDIASPIAKVEEDEEADAITGTLQVDEDEDDNKDRIIASDTGMIQIDEDETENKDENIEGGTDPIEIEDDEPDTEIVGVVLGSETQEIKVADEDEAMIGQEQEVESKSVYIVNDNELATAHTGNIKMKGPVRTVGSDRERIESGIESKKRNVTKTRIVRPITIVKAEHLRLKPEIKDDIKPKVHKATVNLHIHEDKPAPYNFKPELKKDNELIVVDDHRNITIILSVLGTLVVLTMIVAVFYCLVSFPRGRNTHPTA